jgi:lipid-A-disaccharide synthase
MAKKQILIISGEASGDLNASNLAKSILKIDPEIKFLGVGGTLLRQAGVEILCDIKELAVIGFFDALKKLPRFLALQKLILEKIKYQAPDAIILVDFSGFNLRLAKKINKAIPTIYYVSPQVWASRPGRVKTIKKYIHKMIVLFKFEEQFYKKQGIDVNFVGHPLLDTVKPAMNRKDFIAKYNLSGSKTAIALLPGSRKQEIENILPIMLKASYLINKGLGQNNVQFLIAKSLQVDWDFYKRNGAASSNLDLKIIEGKAYDCLASSDFALVASGTATLETAILQKPFVIIYKMDLLNYLLYRPQVRVPYIGIVNIIAGREIIPEFIQFQAQPKNISEKVLRILKDPLELKRIKTELNQIKSLLGEKDASSRAAKIILEYLGTHPQGECP